MVNVAPSAEPEEHGRPESWVLWGILAYAFGVRAWYLSAGVPHAVGVDEPAVVTRALRILQTGDWNPHGFDYPTLVIYLQAWVTIARYLWGTLQGQWASMGALDIVAVYEAGRFVAALIGTATVWLTYRLGKDLDSRALGLVAAAQLAVFPMHVRESHFILTDVPATALVALTLYLTLRAGRRRTISAYGWAGCAAGLSAAAKYNGGVVAVAIGIAWLLYERSAPDRGRKALAALIAMTAAFLVTVPYAILDLPAFLNGLGAQLARFSLHGRSLSDPPWRSYLIHLSLAWRFWVPRAVLGAVMVVWRRRSLKAWVVVIGFVIAYFYVLASHAVVFGRYTLPLLPGMCLLVAVPVIEFSRFGQRRVRHRAAAPVLVVLGTMMITAAFASGSIKWVGQFRRPDTRLIAARWMMATIPRGTRVVVQNGGPTHLDRAGFDLVDQPNDLSKESLDSYLKNGVKYVVIARWSSAALTAYGPFFDAGSVVFSIEPSEKRWGPFVRIVKLTRAD